MQTYKKIFTEQQLAEIIHEGLRVSDKDYSLVADDDSTVGIDFRGRGSDFHVSITVESE